MSLESDLQTVKAVISRQNRTINTKDENYAFYNLGLYGNKALSWKTLEELEGSGWGGMVCVRSKKGIERTKVVYNVPREQLADVLEKFESEGIPLSSLYFNQSMPDEHLTLQGEVMRSQTGLYLFYTKVKKPMNLGLKEQQLHASGIKAKCMLEHELWPNSYEEIMGLLDYFSGDSGSHSSVVEFSAYGVAVGDTPGRNAVIWEVRNY
jgi:hypothetical protein